MSADDRERDVTRLPQRGDYDHEAGMGSVTHICPPPLDASHWLYWLYKAGYADGYQAALRERDLSPMGRSPSGKERGE